MCGISGIIDFKNKINNPLKEINDLNSKNINRGPDDEGVWFNMEKKVFFGHKRLSIIDLSENGRQPFLSKDQKISLIFNGEIYNFKELKKILIAKNYKFRSETDTEVILYSYIEWGSKCVDKFRGMFAIAIWDENIKKLYLIRDPFGIKPLYYFKNDDFFYFSSSIKSLLSVPLVSKKKSTISIVNYLTWGNTIDPDTIYQDIQSVEKGHCLTLDQNMNLKNKKYFDLMSTIADTEPFFFNNIDEGKEYLKEIISETIKYHLISDANNGIALSSGLDSNLILCNIDSHEKIKSLTVDFNIDGSIKDELKIAQLHSLKKGVLNKSINLKELNINDELNFFLENMDTPTNDGFNTLILSKLAKKNDIKVLLTGIGGDEMFMGYPSFSRADKYYNILKLLSEFNYKGFPKKILSSLVEFLNLNLKFSEIFDVNSITDLHKLSRRLFLDKEIKDILIDKKISTNSNNLNYKVKNSNFDKLDTKSKLMFLEIEYYLCPKLLKDTDWTSMTQSVEIRTPFVDSVFFVQYLKLFKSNLKINKNFIYEAYKDVLPSEIGKRKKSGFGIPNQYLNKRLQISPRFKNSLKDWSLNNLNYYIN